MYWIGATLSPSRRLLTCFPSVCRGDCAAAARLPRTGQGNKVAGAYNLNYIAGA